MVAGINQGHFLLCDENIDRNLGFGALEVRLVLELVFHDRKARVYQKVRVNFFLFDFGDLVGLAGEKFLPQPTTHTILWQSQVVLPA